MIITRRPNDTNIVDNAVRRIQLLREEPGQLFDLLIKKFNCKNDAGLARILQVQPPIISKIRNGFLPVGPMILIRMHEESGLSIRKLQELAGVGPLTEVGLQKKQLASN